MKWLAGALCLLSGSMAAAQEQAVAPDTLRVLAYNIWVGGTANGQPLARTVAVLEASQADVLLLQEVNASLDQLAEATGFHAHRISNSCVVLSRWPLGATGRYGTEVVLPGGEIIWAASIHLAPYPYGPYDLRDNPELISDDLIATARDTRARPLQRVLDEIGERAEGKTVLLGGDFNEPSHLDWTAAAAAAGQNFARAVAWPTSTQTVGAGFQDAYRSVYPDPVVHQGWTWTPIESEDEVHDRIDRVYWQGSGWAPVRADILGPADAHTTLPVEPYPSDHRVVLITFARR